MSTGDETRSTVAVPEPTDCVARLGLHGVVSPFDSNQEEWVEYAERLEHYFIANDAK